MAESNPFSNLIEQPDYSLSGNKTETKETVVYRGTKADIDAAVDAIDYDNFDHYEVKRGNGGLCTLTLTRESSSEVSNDEQASPKKAPVWGASTSQITYPIEKYCGPSEGANAQAWKLRAWRAEQDNSLFQNFEFRDSNGNIVALDTNTQRLAEKILSGIESVMRFYPTIVKTTVYTKGKIDGLMSKLGYIDSPGGPYDYVADEYLCVKDDVSGSDDGSQTRVQAWIGAKKIDTDLYGPNRWEFESI